MQPTTISEDFPCLLQNYFADHLTHQRDVSPKTLVSYRDAFRLFLLFLEHRIGKKPSAVTLEDLNVQNVLSFLQYLEQERKNSVRTRNARFAAIRSFLQYAIHRNPATLMMGQRILSVPMKRFDRPVLGFLSHQEIEAILEAPDLTTWSGKRDQVMFLTFYNTGARVTEIIALTPSDLRLDCAPSVTISGKGRKQRTVPLWKKTAKRIREWLKIQPQQLEMPLFPNRTGRRLTKAGVEHRLRLAVQGAAEHLPNLYNRKITPHTIRHTTAMHLLQAGVDLTVIAMWLGHESPSTTHLYLEADIEMKRKALEKVNPPRSYPLRFAGKDKLLRFLESL